MENTPRGPEIILSRSHPNFVRKLFELEVSELNDKTIEIKAMAREAGYRTKIAVWSANEKVDPVGACVGMRGARVKNIVRELNNEKVDLFKWSANIRELVVEALKPAKLKTLEVDEAGHKVTVLVDEENLSLAIGRRGQNARLTQKLTGWEIDVKKEEEVAVQGFEQKLAKATEALAASLQIEPAVAEKIVRAGFSASKASPKWSRRTSLTARRMSIPQRSRKFTRKPGRCRRPPKANFDPVCMPKEKPRRKPRTNP